MWKVAPLNNTFMLAAILGLMITVIYSVYGRISYDWGFALGFLFTLMLVASIISMRYGPIDAQLDDKKEK